MKLYVIFNREKIYTFQSYNKIVEDINKDKKYLSAPLHPPCPTNIRLVFEYFLRIYVYEE